MRPIAAADGISNLVELAVGVACVLAGGALWRDPGLRWVTAVLVVAGLAAIVHAVVAAV